MPKPSPKPTSSWKRKLLWIPAVLLAGLIPGLLVPWLLEQSTINAVDDLLTRARRGEQAAIERVVLRKYASEDTEAALRAISTSTGHQVPFFFSKSGRYVCFSASLDTPAGKTPLSVITYDDGATKIYAMSTTRACVCNAKLTLTAGCSLY